MHVIHQRGLEGDRKRMELCKRWEKTVLHIDEHAQIGNGFKKKTINLWFGKKSGEIEKSTEYLKFTYLSTTCKQRQYLGLV